VERWAKREPSDVSYVETLLQQAGLDQEAIAAETLVLKLVIIERIERMITEKENRRNTMLREIDRHGDGVAQRLRDVATQIEDAEFRGIPRADAAECGFRGARGPIAPTRDAARGQKTPAGKSAASRNALRHEGANPSRLERGRRVAEAQIDLLRVRRARSLLNDARGGAKLPSGSGLFCAEDRTRAVLRALDAVNKTGEPLEGIAELVAQLELFDRCERRALSRRKWATRDFDEDASDR
jgi:hypothetical protein